MSNDMDTVMTADSDPASRVLMTIRRIIRSTDVHSKKLLKVSGLTTPQAIILQAIDELGEVTTRCLSQHVSLSQPTVTTILDRLESRNLVERYRSKVDRRIVHSRLTQTGKKTLKEAPTLLQDQFHMRFSNLSERKQKSILSAINDVAKLMDAETIDASPVLDTSRSLVR